MKLEDFTEFKTGQVVPITTSQGRETWAFVPRPLPGSWEMDTSLYPLLCEARDQVGRLEQIDSLLPEPDLLLRPLMYREALQSSYLEGTFASPEQVLLIESTRKSGKTIAPRNQQESDELEIHNCVSALSYGYDWMADGNPFDESLILELHRILMTGVRGKDKNPGCYRDKQVWVSRRSYAPPPAENITECMKQFVDYLTCDDNTYDPLVRAFIVHYHFEAIHPFEDGNGRVGRVLLSLCVANWVRLTLPWLYMSEYYSRNRDEYTQRLYGVSTNGGWDEWIRFCLQGAIEQASESIKRCKLLKTMKDRYEELVQGRGVRMSRIIDLLFMLPVLRVSDLVNHFEIHYDTARSDIQTLIDCRIVMEMPDSHPKQFVAKDVIDVAFGEVEYE